MNLTTRLTIAAEAAIRIMQQRPHELTETHQYPAKRVSVRFHLEPANGFASVNIFGASSCLAYIEVGIVDPDLVPCAEADLPLVLAAMCAAAHGDTILTVEGEAMAA